LRGYDTDSDAAPMYLYAADTCALPFEDWVIMSRSSLVAALAHGSRNHDKRGMFGSSVSAWSECIPLSAQGCGSTGSGDSYSDEFAGSSGEIEGRSRTARSRMVFMGQCDGAPHGDDSKDASVVAWVFQHPQAGIASRG
jgi:hypothetical protein